MNEYISNILGQPDALRSVLARFELDPIRQVAARIRAGEVDRIILTGMGASLFASYPAWQILAAAGLPAWQIDTGELLHANQALITPSTLLWQVSQSGRGLEHLALLEALSRRRPRLIMATTNNVASPLAGQADIVLPLHTAEEHGVATRTYVNTLAVTQLSALVMAGQDVAPAVSALQSTAEALDTYLQGWEQVVEVLAGLLPEPDRLILLGRGASLAAAMDGALVIKEAARVNAEGMSTGQFRHGPLELADSRLAVMVFAGPAQAAAGDRRLAHTIVECGARALWLGAADDPNLPAVPMPVSEGIGLPIAQIVPIQLLSLYLARLGGFEAAAFRHLDKITLLEP